MICIECVSPEPLKRLISEKGANHICRYCGKDSPAVDSTFLFDFILEMAVDNTATRDELSQYEDWMTFDGGSDEIAVADLDVVLAEWMDLGDEAYFNDLYKYAPNALKFDETGVADRLYFEDHGSLDGNLYDAKWEMFVADIRHSHRFFNSTAKTFLDSVFTFLSSVGGVLKPECIRVMKKGEELYRARSASTYQDAKKIADDPVRQLGPTPKDRASSQRMTPNGISALYCALERKTCLSEIRAITGDNVVSIAMSPVSQLRLLDLTKLGQVEQPGLTLLDKGYRDALHLKTFVSSLVKKMSKPKGRNDELSYLSTQIVFEYLRLRFDSQVDGLIFPSVQTGEKGTNAVLFPEASVISSKNYRTLDDYQMAEMAEPDFESDEEDPFEDEAKLYCIPGSLRFHKVTAIETKAEEYTHIVELFMTPLDRKRMGLEPLF